MDSEDKKIGLTTFILECETCCTDKKTQGRIGWKNTSDRVRFRSSMVNEAVYVTVDGGEQIREVHDSCVWHWRPIFVVAMTLRVVSLHECSVK